MPAPPRELSALCGTRASGLRRCSDSNLQLTVTIPGQPVPQGRPRAFFRPGYGTGVYDPKASRQWKQVARVHYWNALRAAGIDRPAFPAGALELQVLIVFECPTSDHRQRSPAPRRPKDTSPDAENVLKAVQDAGNGLLWKDDGQIARVVAEKIFGAQGEAPFVRVTVGLWVSQTSAANPETTLLTKTSGRP